MTIKTSFLSCIINGFVLSGSLGSKKSTTREILFSILLPTVIRRNGETLYDNLWTETRDTREVSCPFCKECLAMMAINRGFDSAACLGCEFKNNKKSDSKKRDLKEFFERMHDPERADYASLDVYLIERGMIGGPISLNKAFGKKSNKAGYLLADGKEITFLPENKLIIDILEHVPYRYGRQGALFRMEGSRLIPVSSNDGLLAGKGECVDILEESLSYFIQVRTILSPNGGNKAIQLGGITLPSFSTEKEIYWNQLIGSLINAFPPLSVEVVRLPKESEVISVSAFWSAEDSKIDIPLEEASKTDALHPKAPVPAIKEQTVKTADPVRPKAEETRSVFQPTKDISDPKAIEKIILRLEAKYRELMAKCKKEKMQNFVYFVGSDIKRHYFPGINELLFQCFCKELKEETGEGIDMRVIIDKSEEEDRLEASPLSIGQMLKSLRILAHTQTQGPVVTKKQPEVKKESVAIKPVQLPEKKPSDSVLLPDDDIIAAQLWQAAVHFAKFSHEEKGRQDFVIVHQGVHYELKNISIKSARCIAVFFERFYDEVTALYGMNEKGELTRVQCTGYGIRKEVEKSLRLGTIGIENNKSAHQEKTASAPVFLPNDEKIAAQLWLAAVYFARFSHEEKGRQDFVLEYRNSRYYLRNINRRTGRCINMAFSEVHGPEAILFGVSPKGKLIKVENGGTTVKMAVKKYLNQKEAVVKQIVAKPVRPEKTTLAILPCDSVIAAQMWFSFELFAKYSREEKGRHDFVIVHQGAHYALKNISIKSARCIAVLFERFYNEDFDLHVVNKKGEITRIQYMGNGIRKEVEKSLNPGIISLKEDKPVCPKKTASAPVFLPNDKKIAAQLWLAAAHFAKFSRKEKGRQDFVLEYQNSRYYLRNINRRTARCIGLAFSEVHGPEAILFGVSPKGKLIKVENGGMTVRMAVEKYLNQKEAVVKQIIAKPVRPGKTASAPVFLPNDEKIAAQLWLAAAHFAKFSRKEKGRQDFVLEYRNSRYYLRNINRRTARCIGLAFSEVHGPEAILFGVSPTGKLAKVKEGGVKVRMTVKKYFKPVCPEKTASDPVFLPNDEKIAAQLWLAAAHFAKFSRKEKGRQDFVLEYRNSRYHLNNVSWNEARCIGLAFSEVHGPETILSRVSPKGKLAKVKNGGKGILREVSRYLSAQVRKKRQSSKNIDFVIQNGSLIKPTCLKDLLNSIRRICKGGNVKGVYVNITTSP